MVIASWYGYCPCSFHSLGAAPYISLKLLILLSYLQIICNGCAYAIDGDVYLSVDSFRNYVLLLEGRDRAGTSHCD